MLEASQADQTTVSLCRKAVGAAEQGAFGDDASRAQAQSADVPLLALESALNVKSERKLIKIKKNLMLIETTLLK